MGRTILGAAVVSVLLGACGATSERVRGPDGDWWWEIECRRSQENCWDEAGDVCPHGYITADESGGESGAVAIDTGSAVIVKSKYRGNMLIKCKSGSVENGERRCDQDEDCDRGQTCMHYPGDHRGRCK